MIKPATLKKINSVADKIIELNQELGETKSQLTRLPHEIEELETQLSVYRKREPDYSKPIDEILQERRKTISDLELSIENKKNELQLLESKAGHIEATLPRLSAEIKRLRQSAAAEALKTVTEGKPFKDFQKTCYDLYFAACCAEPGMVDKKNFFMNLLASDDSGLQVVEKQLRAEVR